MEKSIIIETTNCYSKLCPVYRAAIDLPTATVRFWEKSNVRRVGMHRGRINEMFLEPLVDFVRTTNFFALPEEYSSGQVDMSMTKITVILDNGMRKTVAFDDLVTESRLLALKLMIINTVNKTVWI